MSDASKFSKNGRPSSGYELGRFPDRLKMVIGEDSLRKFAGKCGLSEGVLRSYLRGDTYPTLDRLNAIASAGRVRVAWLATEEGPMRPEDQGLIQGSAEPLDEEVMGYIIEKTLEVFERDKRYLPPGDMRKLIFAIYYAVKEGALGRQDVESNVILLKKFAS